MKKLISIIVEEIENGFTVKSWINGEQTIYIKNASELLAYIGTLYGVPDIAYDEPSDLEKYGEDKFTEQD